MGLIGDAASAIGGLFQGHFNRKQSRQNTERTIQANRELAEYSYGKDMEQLKYMNEYNTPLNQRKRLEAANLNPALMYKGNPQNTQTELPKYNPPTEKYETLPVDVTGALSTLGQFQDSRIKHAQTDNLKAQEENIKEDTYLKTVQAINAQEKTAKTREEKEILQETRQELVYQAQMRSENAYRDFMLKEPLWNIRKAEENMKKLELMMAQRGIYKGDKAWMRLILQNKAAVKKMFEDANKVPDFQELNKHKNYK